MNFLELAQQRYTTKKYNPTQKIANEKIKTLKQILQLNPSSMIEIGRASCRERV